MNSILVVTRPEIVIAGMSVRASMKTAPALCSALWHETFGPRMHEIASAGQGESYGASWSADDYMDPAEHEFYYWAALPVATGYMPPEGMKTAVLPAGLYAQAFVPTLTELAGAYQRIMTRWLPEHPEYAVLMSAPAYEIYPPDFMQRGALSICFPLQET